LLTERDECERRISEIDREMLGYRKAYAAERGEFLIPTIPRLRRELANPNPDPGPPGVRS
jgi:hypothetical protein